MTRMLLVVVATEAEIPADVAGVELLVCGVGKVAAATETALRLARGGVRGVVSFGVAGAYAGRGLALGDVVLATQVAVLDEGLETGNAFVPFERPGMAVPGAAWTATDPLLRTALAPAEDLPFAVVQGPVGTVSVCAGSERMARERAATGAVAEAMEGAAVAHAASRHGLPFVELRGISNLAGPRDGAAFDLATAVSNAARVLRSRSA